MRKKKESPPIRLSQKLNHVIYGIIVPLVFCIIVILVTLGFYANRYSKITHNVNTGSKFSLDFKSKVDLKMYHYAVGSKEQKDLPVQDVEEAITLAKDLAKTTERKESKQAINNVLDYCYNLEKRIFAFQRIRNYDSRMQQLDTNIYVLTSLIREKMSDYIYYEAGYLTSIQEKMNRDISIVILTLGILIVTAVGILLYRSFRFAKGITTPINKLCENVKAVGQGNFDITSVDSNDYEMAHLNQGIQKMAKRIEVLLEDVKEEEALQHKMQLQLLQAQINPHFLYNTLDTIVWLVEAGKQKEATDMLSNLSVFFRTMLSKGEDIITLKEEVAYTISYLEIQQVRYRDILDYDVVLPKSMEHFYIPKLTLQPLVENALYHGVKEKRGKSKITVTFTEEASKLVIRVNDTGIGITKERLNELQVALEKNEKVGFGLVTVNERLKIYFGERYGVQISSEYGEGTKVTVRVPKKTNL